MSLVTLLLPAIMPALADAVRGIVARFTGTAGAQPQNVDESIRMMEAQTARLQALADLDKPGGDVSRWVSDLRGSYRYLVITAVFVMTGAGASLHWPMEIMGVLLEMSGASMSFVIGERMYLGIRGGRA